MSGKALRQWLAIGLALCLWAALGQPSLAYLLLAYVIGLGVLAIAPLERALEALASPVRWVLLLCLSAPGVAFGARSYAELIDDAGLHGMTTYLADRLRLERLPAIAPPLLAVDRPQTFFVHAPQAREVQLEFGANARQLGAESLGEGLFRVDYDPRRDGVPSGSDGSLQATLRVDGVSVEREMWKVTALAHPRFLAVSPGGQLAAAVSEETDEVFILGSAGLLLRASTEDGPTQCAFLDDEHLAISHRNAEALEIRELGVAGKRTLLRLGARQVQVAVSPDHAWLAVALAGSTPALQLVAWPSTGLGERIALPAPPDWLVFGADAETLIVSSRRDQSLRRLHKGAKGYAVEASLKLGRPAVSLVRSRDGKRVFVATTDYQVDGVPQLGNHFVQDQILTVDIAALQVVRRELTARRTSRQSKPGDSDRGGSPMGMQEARDGSLLVVFAGTDELWRDAASPLNPQITDLGAWPLHAPHGIAQLADGSLVVSSPVDGTLGIFAEGSRTPRIVHVATDDATLLAHDRAALERRVGERGFYEVTRSGIACQSCHIHDESDDAGYNLGEHRLIPTLGVRGLLGTAPYLRDGSYPLIADLDAVAHGIFRGYLRSQRARGQALQSYLEALPRLPNPSAPSERDPRGERRGLSAFVKARCPTCHALPAFTNLGMIPMQTIFPDEAARLPKPEMLDTPSLLSVAATPPYLSDGRAQTLEEVLAKYNRRNLHGNTASLSITERSDLVAFLRSL